jgi:hypothetical protein
VVRRTAVPVSRFTRPQEARTDTLNECGDFTQYRLQRKNIEPRRRENMRQRALPGVASDAIRPGIDGLETLRAVNDIEWLIHHGKSIESCLLLLDLSRFLKL